VYTLNQTISGPDIMFYLKAIPVEMGYLYKKKDLGPQAMFGIEKIPE